MQHRPAYVQNKGRAWQLPHSSREHGSKLRWRQWRLEVIKLVKHLNESKLSHREGPQPRISQAAAHSPLCLRAT